MLIPNEQKETKRCIFVINFLWNFVSQEEAKDYYYAEG